MSTVRLFAWSGSETRRSLFDLSDRRGASTNHALLSPSRIGQSLSPIRALHSDLSPIYPSFRARARRRARARERRCLAIRAVEQNY
jgi:hypothetical protein